MKSGAATPEKLAEIFKTLASKTRLQIIELLKERPLCVGAIASRLGVTQGAVSQHLRIMRGAHLVVPEKRGYFVHYRINEDTLGAWRRAAEGLLSMSVKPKRQMCCEDNDSKEDRACVTATVARNQTNL